MSTEHRRDLTGFDPEPADLDLIVEAADGARSAGCEWLHVDFDHDLEGFYVEACGFRPTRAGLIKLR